MSKGSFYPFLKWGNYKSKDSENPDKIHIKVTELETFETEYGTSINALVDGIKMSVILRNYSSVNRALLRLWMKYIRNRKIRKGTKFILYTHLGKSKNEKTIRKWSMEFAT